MVGDQDRSHSLGVPDGLRVGFTGHEQEDTLGLVDMRGRYYDPSQRRSLTPDPIIAHPLSSQGFSPYAYVTNHPLSRTDPTGFFDGFTDEDRPGALDEGAWSDASGLPDIDGGAGSADGGMSANYDDYDGGDFDPGEAMAGQDEEGGNDGTDPWSDSGSGKGPPTPPAPITEVNAAQGLTGIMRFGHWGGSNETGGPFTDGVTSLEGEFFYVDVNHPYDSRRADREWGRFPVMVRAPGVLPRPTRTREPVWRTHFLYRPEGQFDVTIQITVRADRRPSAARVTHSRWEWQPRLDASYPNDRLVQVSATPGGAMIGQNSVRFRRVGSGEYRARITIRVDGDWLHADRFAVDVRPGFEIHATARAVP